MPRPRGRPGKRYLFANPIHYRKGTQGRLVYDAVREASKDGGKGLTSKEVVEAVRGEFETQGDLTRHVAFHLCLMKKLGVLDAR